MLTSNTGVVARFEYKPERADEFCWSGTTFAEHRFDSVEEVIASCEEWRDSLVDVTVFVNGQVIMLSQMPSA